MPSYIKTFLRYMQFCKHLSPKYRCQCELSHQCVADAVKASCSAYPFFERTIVKTAKGEEIELIDGGYPHNTR